MIAGENSKTAGIVRNRFVKTELSREICDWPFDRGAGAGFSVSVLAREIIFERVVDLFQFAEECFVLREFFQTRLTRKLEHAHGIVVRSVPQIRIEMTEEAARGWLPRPPEVETHFPKRVERRRQGGNHVISVKRW